LKDLGLVGKASERSIGDPLKGLGSVGNPLKQEQMDSMLKDMNKMQVLFASYQIELTRVLKEVES